MNRGLALVIVLAGCGSDPRASPATDAGSGAADGPSPDVAPATGPVTITVRDIANVVAANAAASFANPAGTPTQLAMLDGNGTASATITSGDSVTLVFGAATAMPMIMTIFDLHPGDDLEIVGPPVSPPATLGTAKVTLAAYAGAATYSLSDACTVTTPSPGAATTLPLGPPCVGGANTYDLDAYALDSAGAPLAYQAALDLVPPGQGQTSTITLGTWRTDFAAFPLGVSNAPAGTTSIQVDVATQRDARVFPGETLFKDVAAGAGAVFDLVLPKGAWTGDRYTITAKSDHGFSRLIRQVDAGAGLVTHDLSTDLLPYLSTAAIDASPANTPRIQVTAAGDVGGSDGVIAVFGYATAAGNVLGIAVSPPPTTPAIARVLPSLPDALAAVRPSQPFDGRMQDVFVIAGAYASAKAWREHWSDLLYSASPPTVDLGSTVRVSATP